MEAKAHKDTISANNDELIAIVVTFRRPRCLENLLDALSGQTLKPAKIVIVDNAPSTTNQAIIATARQRGQCIEYLPQGDNLGPAGGIAVGMKFVTSIANDDNTWVVLLDDDDPPWRREALERLWAFAHEMLQQDPLTGGVGDTGSRFVLSRGRVEKIPLTPNLGPYRVDSIGGNHLPLYRVSAIRKVGPFQRDIFFGFEELEFGLRMNRCGYRLYVDGTELNRFRRSVVATPNRDPSPPSWRRYYSTRNLIYILRKSGAVRGALAVSIRSLARLVRCALRRPSEVSDLPLAFRAIVDGWASNMGRQVDPCISSSDDAT